MRIVIATSISALLLAAIVQPIRSTVPVPTVYLLKPARIFDGESAQIHAGWVVLVRGEKIEAVGLARAKGFGAQAQAIGAEATAAVNVVSELVKSENRFVPDILVTGGGDATSAGIMGFLREFQRHGSAGSVRGAAPQ